MKRLALVSLFAALSACSHTYDGGVEDPEPYVIDRERETLEVEIPDGDVQFAGFCVFEGRMLTPWSESRGDAESSASTHASRGHSHESTVIWRQTPTVPLKHVPFPGPSDSARP